ncbi:hypothetical protein GCM10010869_32600 [Mesorhizobium tianshanense]|uniref:Uncharacterized protein n=1 Tax=Mesorhizobium tianshanense TaxID=39844 RepID=A0A562P5A4_9HYPH|nr:hypothetical protein [Mesorhizobium tianshanense]TWI39635.1 hypothetical protein IQ26_01865 [Mesorhizobium tianshanense]GLS37666.1 hypothetical protein GCM10010869_32600 [Mesorhizobium tianshanense]
MVAKPNKRDVQAFCLKQYSSQSQLSAPGGGPADKRGGDHVLNKNGKKSTGRPDADPKTRKRLQTGSMGVTLPAPTGG